MRKLLALFVLFAFIFCLANLDSVQAAKKGKKDVGGISQEELTAIGSDIDLLTRKIYESSLFSPEENAKIMKIKMQLDDQMLITPDPTYAPLYFKLGNLLKSRGYKDEAIECYQTILENFADTALAPKAANALKAMGVVIKDPSAQSEDGAAADSGDSSGTAM